MMGAENKKIPIGKDVDGSMMFKVELPDIKSNLRFFNSSDVMIGNPMSNVAVAFIYDW